MAFYAALMTDRALLLDLGPPGTPLSVAYTANLGTASRLSTASSAGAEAKDHGQGGDTDAARNTATAAGTTTQAGGPYGMDWRPTGVFRPYVAEAPFASCIDNRDCAVSAFKRAVGKAPAVVALSLNVVPHALALDLRPLLDELTPG